MWLAILLVIVVLVLGVLVYKNYVKTGTIGLNPNDLTSLLNPASDQKSWVIADTITLQSDQPVVSLKAPTNYAHLKLVAQGRVKRANGALNSTTSVCVRFNGDSSASYTRQINRVSNGGTVFSYGTEPFIYTGEWPLNANDTAGVLVADVPFYNNTNNFKNLLGNSGTTSFVQSTYGRYLKKDAVNSVQFVDALDGSFEAGSTFTLYAYM